MSAGETSANGLGVDGGTVAALFVEAGGCYFGIPNVEPWPKERDARNYRGPHPVVAHPPCQLWGAMAFVNYARWGGEHNRPGNDGGCFAFALDAVNFFGGVLEHPAKTRAWAEFGLDRPARHGWARSCKGWVCEVWQSAYGHRANKATWLYYVGERPPFELRWDRPIGTHQVGFHDQRGKDRNKPTLSKREANATPTAFRDDLIRLAQWAYPPHKRPAMTETPWTDREQWAESEAKFCDQMVGDYRRMATEWAAKPCYAENYKMAQQCALFAQAWQQMAWHLRKPRNCRLEWEQSS